MYFPVTTSRAKIAFAGHQHFQGLRRAQNKADTNGGLLSNSPQKAVDPTLNPITRRPGPGRGRPRKKPAAASTSTSTPDQDQRNSQSQEPSQGPPGEATPMPSISDPMAAPVQNPIGVSDAMSMPVPVPAPEPLGLTTNGDESEEQHAAKRPRLDEPGQEALDDEAVLALAAHDNPPETYPSPTFNYGEP